MTDISWDDLRVAVPEPGQYAYRQPTPAERDHLARAWLREHPEYALQAAAINRVEANLGKIEEEVDHGPNCRACMAVVSRHSVRAVLDALDGAQEDTERRCWCGGAAQDGYSHLFGHGVYCRAKVLDGGQEHT